MFRIYTKEKNSRELFNVNLNAKEVAELMGNNLFLDYPNINKDDCIIVEQEEAFKHPTFVEGIIREKTREELIAEGIAVQLEAGEIIQDKKLVKIPQPSKWHTWNGAEWVVNLEEVKASKREELKTIRKEKIDSDLEVNENSFQVRERDLQNFYNLKIAVDLEPARASMRTAWVLADNTIKEFSFTELMGVLGAYILRKSEMFAKFGELCTRLETCSIVEEIEAIKWE